MKPPIDTASSVWFNTRTMTNTKQTAARAAIAHRAAMRATARARRAFLVADRAAHHPNATAATWTACEAARLNWRLAQEAQETARIAAHSARVAYEAAQTIANATR